MMWLILFGVCCVSLGFGKTLGYGLKLLFFIIVGGLIVSVGVIIFAMFVESNGRFR